MAGKDKALILSSPGFVDGARMPDRYTCEGANVSPPLAWTGIPAKTRSLVILLQDPDAPAGIWHHWAAYDIPGDLHALPEAIPAEIAVSGFRQAFNDFRRPGYGGPCPPPGHGTHRYKFTLMALSVATLPIGPKPSCQEVEAQALRHVLAQARLGATFSRGRD